MNSENKTCQNCKTDFTIEPEDFDFYEKIKVPPPTWCPECRMKRRMAFMNNRELYRRTCDLCGKSIMSMYPPDRKITIYCNPCWWSDKWDGTQYAKDYDPSQPFLRQAIDLTRATPHMALESNYPTLINSEYVNHAATAKNCYLIFIADECENVLYSELLLHNKDCMDATILERAELCYEVVNCGNSYQLFYSEDCDGCRNVYFSKDCIGCSDCFGCVGLRNKQYHIFNVPHTKEDYQQKLKEFGLDSHGNVMQLQEQARDFWRTRPHKFAHALRNVNTTGDYVYGAKNAKDMYIVSEGTEDSRYCQVITMSGVKDSYDYSMWGNGAQRLYEAMIVGEGADSIRFATQVWPNVRDIEYSMTVMSSSNMFGCVNMRNKQYCILNKEYSKGEYEKLRAQIIGDMDAKPYIDSAGRRYAYGEFLPPDMSLFGYNESYAALFFPMTREEAKAQGFSWYDAHPSSYAPTVRAEDLPRSIKDVQDSIVQEIIECSRCKKSFRIVTAELALLRRFGLPLPRMCPNCRYAERFSRVNPPRLAKRKCECAGVSANRGKYQNTTSHFHADKPCPNEFQTSYAPDRPEIVYCEQCYNSEVA